MSVLKKPQGDDIVAQYGPYFSLERIQQFKVGERYEILSVDERWYHVEVEEFSADSLIATLHFPHWQRRFDYHGSLRQVYMAEIGTYSAVTSHNKYQDPNSGQKPERKPIVKDKSKPLLSYEAKTKYDANFFSKPRPAWAKKRRAPSQDPGDDGNNSESSDGKFFNVNGESMIGSNGWQTQQKEQYRSSSSSELIEKREKVEKKRESASNGDQDGGSSSSSNNRHRRVTFNEEHPARPRHVLFEMQMEGTDDAYNITSNFSTTNLMQHPTLVQPPQTAADTADNSTTNNKDIANTDETESSALAAAGVTAGSKGIHHHQQVDWAGEMLHEFDFDADKAVCQSLQAKLNNMMSDPDSTGTKKGRMAMKKVSQLLKVRQLIDESLEILLQRERLNSN